MTLLSDNVIPGNHGKIFGTNAQEHSELAEIKVALLKVEGVSNVVLNEEIYPREFTVHTSQIVPIKKIEDAVISAGFHAIPKNSFPLPKTDF